MFMSLWYFAGFHHGAYRAIVALFHHNACWAISGLVSFHHKPAGLSSDNLAILRFLLAELT